MIYFRYISVNTLLKGDNNTTTIAATTTTTTNIITIIITTFIQIYVAIPAGRNVIQKEAKRN